VSRTILALAIGISMVPPALDAAANGITATPAALVFAYQIGATALPVAQTLQVQTTPAGTNFTIAISGAPFNAAWLLVSAAAGVSPASLKVQVNPTGLPAGSYAGTITCSATIAGSPAAQNVAVTLNVSTAAPTVSATPSTLNFTYVTGAPIPSLSLASAFILSSTGAALSATVSVTGATWLTVSPTGNVSLIGLLNTIAVSVNPTGLAPKTYSAAITIAAPAATDKTVTVNVTLTVDAAPPTITGTWPTGVIQGSGASAITIDGSSYYASSTVAASGFTPASAITVTDGTSTTSQTFYIPAYQPASTALRLAEGSPLPSGIVGTAYTQPLAGAGGTAPYAYTIVSGALPAGLSISAANIAGTPTAAGSYQFGVQVTDSSATSIATTALMQLTIAPSASAALRLTVAAAPLPLGSVGTAYGPVTLTAAGGTGGPYTWTALNLPPGMALSAAGVLSGTPSTDGALGAIPAAIVGSTALLAAVPPVDFAAAGILRLAVTTPPPGGGTSNEVQFQVYGPGPQILAVTNSASLTQGTVAPGELVAIFGIGLGPAALTIFDPATPPIPTVLPAVAPSTSVTINGTAAPILYTSATQIGVIVPYSLAGASAIFIVTNGALVSQPFTVAVAAAGPGIYSLAASGQGPGAILNFDAANGNYTINSSSNPAPRGSIAVIYMTGAGTTTSAVYNQLIAASPAVTPILAPAVTVGGAAATVLAAQDPPGSVPGVIQINITVPSSIQPGATQPVIVTMGGIASQTGLTMAVK
jgi:trimeric autotransporter adhesin